MEEEGEEGEVDEDEDEDEEKQSRDNVERRENKSNRKTVGIDRYLHCVGGCMYVVVAWLDDLTRFLKYTGLLGGAWDQGTCTFVFARFTRFGLQKERKKTWAKLAEMDKNGKR